MRLFALRSSLALALALSALGCADLAEQLQAENVAIATLVRTPDAENPQTHETVKGGVAFGLFFGQIDKSKINIGTDGKQLATAGAFKGLEGADVKLDFTDATGAVEINVPHKKDGNYEITSETASKLTYSHTDYEVLITYSGTTYKLKVTAPEKTEIKEFSEQADHVVHDHAAGSPFTLTRKEALGPAKNPIAFATLSAITGATKSDQPWTNAPKDALGFLQLVLDDSAYRADSFTIPGSEFAAQTGYVATLTGLERGEPEAGAPALFLGSSFMAGVAGAGGIITK